MAVYYRDYFGIDRGTPKIAGVKIKPLAESSDAARIEDILQFRFSLSNEYGKRTSYPQVLFFAIPDKPGEYSAENLILFVEKGRRNIPINQNNDATVLLKESYLNNVDLLMTRFISAEDVTLNVNRWKNYLEGIKDLSGEYLYKYLTTTKEEIKAYSEFLGKNTILPGYEVDVITGELVPTIVGGRRGDLLTIDEVADQIREKNLRSVWDSTQRDNIVKKLAMYNEIMHNFHDMSVWERIILELETLTDAGVNYFTYL